MKLPTLLALTTLVTASAFAQGEFYQLKLHEPKIGEAVIIHSLSNSANGSITVTSGATKQKGSVSIERERSFERTVLGSGPKAQLHYTVLSDLAKTSTYFGGIQDSEAATGALVGKSALGFRDASNRWRLYLKGSTASGKQAVELAELEAYENRRWFPFNPVKVGQTWPIDPGFIRHLTERDLGTAKVRAIMTFKSVETIDQEKTAVLTFGISTLGQQEGSTSSESAAASITGTLHVALDTMLDKKLIMTGTLTTTASLHGQTTTARLPISYVVTKTTRRSSAPLP